LLEKQKSNLEVVGDLLKLKKVTIRKL